VGGGAFEATLIEEGAGFAGLIVEGTDADVAFRGEPGGHRYQRIPPNERSGRVHSSTVTVAVLALAAQGGAPPIRDRDVEITTTRGSGPGGQHRNTTDSCVLAKHLPTGLSVRIDGRSQIRNRQVALEVLAARVQRSVRAGAKGRENDARRVQIGSGMRGDKIRTYRTQEGVAIDHRTGARWPLEAFRKGILG
jgi:peptide chain release factor 1